MRPLALEITAVISALRPVIAGKAAHHREGGPVVSTFHLLGLSLDRKGIELGVLLANLQNTLIFG
jgi:hypothetical protein